MKTNDYIKYLTQTVVKYIEQPKDERKRMKKERKEDKENFWFRWFGLIPYLFRGGVSKKGK